jgi:hypothetical protein
MCEICIRLILANHTDPATGIFTGLDLRGPEPRPLLPERESESATTSNESPKDAVVDFTLGE